MAGEQIILEQGDAFTFTANIEHTFRVPPPGGPAQVLWVVSPALPDHGLDAPPPADPHSEGSKSSIVR